MNKLTYDLADFILQIKIPFAVELLEESAEFVVDNDVLEVDEFMEFIPVDAIDSHSKHGVWNQQRFYENGTERIFFYAISEDKPYAYIDYSLATVVCYYLRDNRHMVMKSKHLLNMIGLELFLLRQKALILHASLIECEGKGILFSAASGTGKSTQAELWKIHKGAEILNGDRAAIRKVDGIWKAYGLPYAGSSGIYCKKSAELGAIVLLKQGKENLLREVNGKEAIVHLLPEFSLHRWDEEFMRKALSVILDILKDVKIYTLECRPDYEAVDLLYNKIYF